MSLPERIKYVRTNLPSPRGSSFISHADFAALVGSPNDKAPIRWEATTVPKRFAPAIAALTPYPADLFGGPGEAELVRVTLLDRLRPIEDEVEWLRTQIFLCLAALQLEPEEESPAAQSAGAPR